MRLPFGHTMSCISGKKYAYADFGANSKTLMSKRSTVIVAFYEVKIYEKGVIFSTRSRCWNKSTLTNCAT